MAGPVSIRERILMEIERRLKVVAAPGRAARWHDRGSTAWSDGDLLIAERGETAEAGAIGDPGYSRKRLDVQVAPVIRAGNLDTRPFGAVASHLIAAVQRAILNDPQLHEGASGVRLAVDSRCEEIGAPEWGEGEATVGVQITVEYDHDRDNPYSYGSAIRPLYAEMSDVGYI